MLMGVLQIQPGEAWLRRTSEPLAVFQFSSPCQQRWLPANWGSDIESLNGADFGE